MGLIDMFPSLIKEYIKRQAIVEKCLKEKRPDLLAMVDKTISDTEVVRLVEAHKHEPNSGVWEDSGQNWTYYIHGKGCRITNNTTSEPIEWDIPDIDVFDRYWFGNWVRWWLNYNKGEMETHNSPHLTNDDILQHLLKMVASGELESIGTANTKYRLKDVNN
jgi:hypothetical protein